MVYGLLQLGWNVREVLTQRRELESESANHGERSWRVELKIEHEVEEGWRKGRRRTCGFGGSLVSCTTVDVDGPEK